MDILRANFINRTGIGRRVFATFLTFVLVFTSIVPAQAKNFHTWEELDTNRQEERNVEVAYEEVAEVGEACAAGFAKDPQKGGIATSNAQYIGLAGQLYVLPPPFENGSKEEFLNQVKIKQTQKEIQNFNPHPSTYKSLVDEASQIYLSGVIYNWIIQKEMFQGNPAVNLIEFAQDPRIHPALSKAVEARKSLTYSPPSALNPDQLQDHIQVFNDQVREINSLCADSHFLRGHLLKVYGNKKRETGMGSKLDANFEVADFILDESNTGLMANLGYDGAIRNRNSRMEEEAFLQIGLHKAIMSMTMFGKMYASNTQLRNHVGSFESDQCVQFGSQLKELPTDHDAIWKLLGNSYAELASKYKKSITEFLEKPQDDPEDVLKDYVESNPGSIQMAMLANPSRVRALTMCNVLHEMHASQESKSAIFQMLAPVALLLNVMTLGASTPLTGSIIAYSALALNLFFIGATAMDLSLSYELEDKLQASILAGQIDEQMGRSMMDHLASSRPFSYLNLVLAGVGVKVVSSRIAQLNKMQRFRKFLDGKGGLSYKGKPKPKPINPFSQYRINIRPFGKAEIHNIARQVRSRLGGTTANQNELIRKWLNKAPEPKGVKHDLGEAKLNNYLNFAKNEAKAGSGLVKTGPDSFFKSAKPSEGGGLVSEPTASVGPTPMGKPTYVGQRPAFSNATVATKTKPVANPTVKNAGKAGLQNQVQINPAQAPKAASAAMIPQSKPVMEEEEETTIDPNVAPMPVKPDVVIPPVWPRIVESPEAPNSSDMKRDVRKYLPEKNERTSEQHAERIVQGLEIFNVAYLEEIIEIARQGGELGRKAQELLENYQKDQKERYWYSIYYYAKLKQDLEKIEEDEQKRKQADAELIENLEKGEFHVFDFPKMFLLAHGESENAQKIRKLLGMQRTSSGHIRINVTQINPMLGRNLTSEQIAQFKQTLRFEQIMMDVNMLNYYRTIGRGEIESYLSHKINDEAWAFIQKNPINSIESYRQYFHLHFNGGQSSSLGGLLNWYPAEVIFVLEQFKQLHAQSIERMRVFTFGMHDEKPREDVRRNSVHATRKANYSNSVELDFQVLEREYKKLSKLLKERDDRLAQLVENGIISPSLRDKFSKNLNLNPMESLPHVPLVEDLDTVRIEVQLANEKIILDLAMILHKYGFKTEKIYSSTGIYELQIYPTPETQFYRTVKGYISKSKKSVENYEFIFNPVELHIRFASASVVMTTVEFGLDTVKNIVQNELETTELHEIRHLFYHELRELGVPSIYHQSYRWLNGELNSSDTYKHYVSAEEIPAYGHDLKHEWVKNQKIMRSVQGNLGMPVSDYVDLDEVSDIVAILHQLTMGMLISSNEILNSINERSYEDIQVNKNDGSVSLHLKNGMFAEVNVVSRDQRELLAEYFNNNKSDANTLLHFIYDQQKNLNHLAYQQVILLNALTNALDSYYEAVYNFDKSRDKLFSSKSEYVQINEIDKHIDDLESRYRIWENLSIIQALVLKIYQGSKETGLDHYPVATRLDVANWHYVVTNRFEPNKLKNGGTVSVSNEKSNHLRNSQPRPAQDYSDEPTIFGDESFITHFDRIKFHVVDPNQSRNNPYAFFRGLVSFYKGTKVTQADLEKFTRWILNQRAEVDGFEYVPFWGKNEHGVEWGYSAGQIFLGHPHLKSQVDFVFVVDTKNKAYLILRNNGRESIHPFVDVANNMDSYFVNGNIPVGGPVEGETYYNFNTHQNMGSKEKGTWEKEEYDDVPELVIQDVPVAIQVVPSNVDHINFTTEVPKSDYFVNKGTQTSKVSEFIQKLVDNRITFQQLENLPLVPTGYYRSVRILELPGGEEFYFKMFSKTTRGEEATDYMLTEQEYAVFLSDQKLTKRYADSFLLEVDGELIFFSKKMPELEFNYTDESGRLYQHINKETLDKLYVDRTIDDPSAQNPFRYINKGAVKFNLPEDVILFDFLWGITDRYPNKNVALIGKGIFDYKRSVNPLEIPADRHSVLIFDGGYIFHIEPEKILEQPVKFTEWYEHYFYDLIPNTISNPRAKIKELLVNNPDFVNRLAQWTPEKIKKDLHYLYEEHIQHFLNNRQTLLDLAFEAGVFAPANRSTQPAILDDGAPKPAQTNVNTGPASTFDKEGSPSGGKGDEIKPTPLGDENKGAAKPGEIQQQLIVSKIDELRKLLPNFALTYEPDLNNSSQKALFEIYRIFNFYDPVRKFDDTLLSQIAAKLSDQDLSKTNYPAVKINHERKRYAFTNDLEAFKKEIAGTVSRARSNLIQIDANLGWWLNLTYQDDAGKTKKLFSKEDLDLIFSKEFKQQMLDKKLPHVEKYRIYFDKIYGIIQDLKSRDIVSINLYQMLIDIPLIYSFERASKSELKITDAIQLIENFRSIISEADRFWIYEINEVFDLYRKEGKDNIPHYWLAQDLFNQYISDPQNRIFGPFRLYSIQRIQDMLDKYESDVLATAPTSAFLDEFIIRELSMAESALRSLLTLNDCATLFYPMTALDPKYIYFTRTDPVSLTSRQQVTTIEGTVNGHKALFVDKIHDIESAEFLVWIEAIRLSAMENGYILAFPQDVSNHPHGLSNSLAIQNAVKKLVDTVVDENKIGIFLPRRTGVESQFPTVKYTAAEKKPKTVLITEPLIGNSSKVEVQKVQPREKLVTPEMQPIIKAVWDLKNYNEDAIFYYLVIMNTFRKNQLYSFVDPELESQMIKLVSNPSISLSLKYRILTMALTDPSLRESRLLILLNSMNSNERSHIFASWNLVNEYQDLLNTFLKNHSFLMNEVRKNNVISSEPINVDPGNVAIRNEHLTRVGDGFSGAEAIAIAILNEPISWSKDPRVTREVWDFIVKKSYFERGDDLELNNLALKFVNYHTLSGTYDQYTRMADEFLEDRFKTKERSFHRNKALLLQRLKSLNESLLANSPKSTDYWEDLADAIHSSYAYAIEWVDDAGFSGLQLHFRKTYAPLSQMGLGPLNVSFNISNKNEFFITVSFSQEEKVFTPSEFIQFLRRPFPFQQGHIVGGRSPNSSDQLFYYSFMDHKLRGPTE